MLYMQKISLFIVVILVFVSCRPGNRKKDPGTSGEKQVTGNIEEYRLKTKTGKEFHVIEYRKSASLSDLSVVPVGFEEVNDTMHIMDADPVSEVFTADINNDGFDELYIITRSAGSGSYATVYAYSSNRDKSVTPVYVNPPTDQEYKKIFEGYMGHDSVYVSENHFYRKFPVYRKGDDNCCPSGGTKVIEYVLKPGEASWLLEVKQD